MNLLEIKSEVEKFDKQKQIDILRIFLEDKCNVTENNNGCFINLSQLNEETLQKIVSFIEYKNKQEEYIAQYEHKKNELKKNYME